MIRRFVLAARFLTRLPIPGPCAGPEELGRSASYFPGVGLLIGALVALGAVGAARIWENPLLAGAVAVIINAVVTGGLHLDGLMDTCDGLFGAHTRERALEIMRDPRIGSFGMLGGLCATLLRFALSAVPGGAGWQGLLLAPVAGRAVQVWAVAAFPYARPEGTGKAFQGGAGAAQVIAAVVLAAVLGAAFAGIPGLIWLGAGCVGGAAAALAIHRRLGGLTGDSYGAVTEVAEWGALAAAALLPGGVPAVSAALKACF